MAFFRRRGQRIPAVEPVLLEVPEPPAEEARRTLLRVAAEALILQDEADAVLAGVRTRQHMGVLAPRAGPLVRRFFAMRDLLPQRYADPDAERLRALLDSILHHHALLLSMALDLLAYEWRSERIAEQVDAIDGMGVRQAVGWRICTPSSQAPARLPAQPRSRQKPRPEKAILFRDRSDSSIFGKGFAEQSTRLAVVR